MKKTTFFLTFILFSFLIFSVRFISFAEDSTGTTSNEMPQEAKEYYGILNRWAEMGSEEFLKELDQLTEKDLRHLASLIFRTREYDPIQFERYFYIEGKKYNENLAKGVRRGSKPSFVYYKLFEKIQNELPPPTCVLLKAPYCVIISVIAVRESLDTSEPRFSFNIIEVKCNIESSLYGGLREGEKITFYYLKQWTSAPKFEVGEQCLIFLNYMPFDDSIFKDYKLVLEFIKSGYIGENFERANKYPVIGEVLYDYYNTFGYGNEVELNEFRKLIKADVEKIKNPNN